jgi:hypothetical protein
VIFRSPPKKNTHIMNRKLSSTIAAVLCLSAVNARAAVAFSQVDATDNTAWTASFGGGNLAVSMVAATSNSSTPMTVANPGNGYFGQSFKGNDQAIEGWGFFGNGGNSSALTYTITLLDYGTSGPIDTYSEFNPVTPASTLVATTFSLGGSAGKKQMFFDFSGSDAVTLSSTHYYSMSIISPSGSSATFHRLSGGASTYADGTGAYGNAVLSPDTFAGTGALRDTIFALYTAPAAAVPEPSTYAAISGLLVAAFAASRRKRS